MPPILHPPSPRSGLLGSWDRFVGPGMNRGENALMILASLGGALVAGWQLSAAGKSWPLVLLGSFIGVDVIGGVVCNMTMTTKRWYHRAGQRFRDHLRFIALHLSHIAVVAWAFRGEGFDAAYALTIGGWLIASAVGILCAPENLRSPLAAMGFLVAMVLSLYVVFPTPGLEWFAPMLFTKLLIGHAVPPTWRYTC